MIVSALWLSVALSATPTLQSVTGPDGLDVLVVNLPSASCSVRLVVRAGAAEDPTGKSGLAHAVEHLVLGGPPGRLAFVSSRSRINARTTAGGTVFMLDTTAEHCAAELQNFLSVVTEAKFRRGWFDPEMSVIQREAMYRIDTRSILDTSLFGNSSATVIGTETTRAQLRHVDVVRYFQQYYVPANMALVVAGSLDLPTVEAAIHRGFKLAPSLESERLERVGKPMVVRGESKVIGMRPGVIALATSLPLGQLPKCRVAAGVLLQRLTQRLSPGNVGLECSCLIMQGNLLLTVIAATEPADQSRVREIADATREQSAASTSIAQRVEEISNMVESTSENIRGAADAAVGLERIAVSLKDQIARFRV